MKVWVLTFLPEGWLAAAAAGAEAAVSGLEGSRCAPRWRDPVQGP